MIEVDHKTHFGSLINFQGKNAIFLYPVIHTQNSSIILRKYSGRIEKSRKYMSHDFEKKSDFIGMNA